MSTPNPQVRYRYDDYKSLSDHTDKRYELLNGDILMVPSPTTSHQRVSRDLGFLLFQHVRANKLGEVFFAPIDVVLGQGSDREVAQPDILFVSAQRRAIIAEGEIQGAPDLMVEILSPSTEALDRGYKKALYARRGVSEYWIVDPKSQTIEVYSLSDAGFSYVGSYQATGEFTSPLLPRFAPVFDELSAPA